MNKENKFLEESPLVTICITTYNRMQLLPAAVSSVLDQTYKNFELIIVNDCSTDDTDKLVEQLVQKDARIKYIRHSTNKGLAAARNTAIFNAKGKYFTFIDDDDRWTNNFVAKFVETAEQYDHHWCFCCGSVTKDAIGQVIYRGYNNLEGKLLDYVKAGYTPPVASQFYVTSSLTSCGGYHEDVKSGVDHDLWLTLAFRGIYLKSVDQYLSLPSEVLDVNRSKMTNAYDKRMKGLTNSFEIWRKSIVEHFGEEFYKRFVKAYVIREKKKFFRLYLFKFNILNAFKLYRDLGTHLPYREAAKILIITIILHSKIPMKRKKFGTIGPGLKITQTV